MKMTFYTANCRGNAKNSLYQNKRLVDNDDDILEDLTFQHIKTAENTAIEQLLAYDIKKYTDFTPKIDCFISWERRKKQCLN